MERHGKTQGEVRTAMATTSPSMVIMSRLTSGDPAQIVDVLREIGPDDASEELEGHLLSLLRGTQDPGIRNAAAIALADMRSKRVPEAIERLVLDPSTKEHRATLLYALEETGAPVSLRFIVDVLLGNIGDNLHACEECFGILDQSPVVASAREKDEQLRRLRSYADGVEDATRRALLEDAYETIQRLPKSQAILILRPEWLETTKQATSNSFKQLALTFLSLVFIMSVSAVLGEIVGGFPPARSIGTGPSASISSQIVSYSMFFFLLAGFAGWRVLPDWWRARREMTGLSI